PGLVGPAEREPAARFLVAERQHVLEGVELAALRVAEVLCKNPRFARRVLSTVPTVDLAHALRELGLEGTDLDTPPDRERSRSMHTAYTLELLDGVVARAPDSLALPRCPNCAAILATDLAKQCFECGHDGYTAP
ncbi:MAG: hypothetical protein AAFP22_11200, partial [Planctomycetota bacterium]